MATRARKTTKKTTAEGSLRSSFKKSVGSVSYVVGTLVETVAIINKVLPDDGIGYSEKLSVKDQIKTSYHKGRNDLSELVKGWLED